MGLQSKAPHVSYGVMILPADPLLLEFVALMYSSKHATQYNNAPMKEKLIDKKTVKAAIMEEWVSDGRRTGNQIRSERLNFG